ncbi:MAG: LysR family transcriptional regulator [Proteobacteria bacterium]|nr:MAG: LysR family transcriptional regulator [Pseudomonadota bacterium]
MDFIKLNAFVIVAEELNFRRSAELLGMSQPPLSRMIVALEDEIGTKLFERTTRQVRLTAAGLILLSEARDILASIDKLRSRVRDASKIKQGRLNIGFSTTAFLARFPVIIEEFEKLYPKIKVDLVQEQSKVILRGLKDGTYDVGFVEAIPESKGLESIQVSEETLGALVKSNHRLAKRREIEFSELEEETIILHHKREAEDFFERISRLIQGQDHPAKIYIKGPNESCPILVATGKGIALTIAGAQKMAMDGTKFIPIKGMFLPVSAFWKPSNSNPCLDKFLDAARENKSLRHSTLHCLNLNNFAVNGKI